MRAFLAVLTGLGLLTVGLPAAGTEERVRLPHEFLNLPSPTQVRHFDDPLAELAALLLGPNAHLAGELEVLAVGAQNSGSSDYGQDLARDGQGNLVMVGTTYTGNRNNPYDVLLAKWLPTGQASWVKRFNGAPYEQAYGVAVDPEGNLLVAGYRVAKNSSHVPFVAKFAGDGTLLWSKVLTNSGLRYGYAAAIATDAEGNVLLAGYGYTSHWRPQPLVARLSPQGAVGFVKLLPTTANEAYLDVAADGAGNLLLAGLRYGNGYDMVLRKLSPTGEDLGAAVVDTASYEYATSLALDPTGGIVLVGPANHGDASVARLKPDLTVDWTRKVDLPGYASNFDVAVDKLGGVALGGSMYTPHCCGSDYVVAKFLPGGHPLFLRTLDLSDYDYGGGVAVTPYGGEIILGGTSRNVYGSSSGADLVVVRSLGASGTGTVLPTLDSLPTPDLHKTPVPLPPLP